MNEKKRTPDYIATTVTDTTSGQSRWREIGVAFVNAESDTITVLLDAVPVAGKIVLTKPRRQVDEGPAVEAE